ncbi:methyltransferase family protein [Thaumasiovibrio subtropicus]|uniref:methyltransferase family protein n=1 Tax=Thaumasiovibrio subtropicus TaxID=1891207 RepID=UPI000B354F85|nr:isoprenylcysteine carboxylmethyltransferase family protein [Thaumasiovibrio subtropicus]
MKTLALKVPPPMLFVTALGVMYGVSLYTPHWQVDVVVARYTSIGLFSLGLSIAIAATVAFKRHKTTVDPRHPEKSSSLVTKGIYRFTRNPMYLCLVLWLVCWAIYLHSPVALIIVTLFIVYLTQYQIKPEERMLSARFGKPYLKYTTRVRRWL